MSHLASFPPVMELFLYLTDIFSVTGSIDLSQKQEKMIVTGS